ncbi:translocation/assembly module TamB [Aliifodinibius sp. S!AR15-10]|uniref:translocation/assembly module TamB domain-containing protein n=1 Tax=Aliifodinibius sp. S!AR15-10 TaxID=2950437 RepID=UPI0028621C75|nr:hypothetical protein [Aliifodinibius sp. S!AR15-10]MDR8390401.1 translocation/assembly module TamB [Aliifodinibius sp. S!AR15-10]
MVLRWIHNIWKYFWRIILVLLLVILLVGGGLFGILQLDSSKNYVANQIEQRFNSRFNGKLAIGNLQGLMPFRFELTDVSLMAAAPGDSTYNAATADSVITIKKLNTQIDLWSLLQNKISIVDFQLQHPEVRFLSDIDNSYTLSKALQPREKHPETERQLGDSWIQQVEIIAPLLTIQNGSVYVDRFHGDTGDLDIPEPFQSDSISTTMFLELSEIQRFLDFESFSGDLHNMNIDNVRFSGQIYNDSRYLEFNAFNITTPQSELTVSGQIDGINLESDSVRQQLPDARYNLDINSEKFVFDEFATLVPSVPDIKEPLDFSIDAEGILDSLQLNRFELGIGESYLSINGLMKKLKNLEEMNYRFDLQDLALRKRDLEVITGPLNQAQFQVFESLRMKGKVAGTPDSLDMDLNIDSPSGAIGVKGYTQLRSPFRYSGSLSGKNIDISPFLAQNIDTTNINLDASFNGIGHDLSKDLLNFSASLYSSSIDSISIEEMSFDATLVEGFLEHSYRYRTGNERLNGQGWIDFDRDETQYALKGEASDLDLSRYFRFDPVPQTRLNLDYNVELQGLQADRVQGRANLDVKPSAIGADTVNAHQIYMDLDSPDLQSRTFRLTSTLFDMTLRGDIKPTNMYRQVNYWSRYIGDRIRHEIMLDSLASEENYETAGATPESIALEGELVTKDLELIRHYWPDLPRIVSNSTLNFDFRADDNRLLLTADSRTDTLIYNMNEAFGATARLTASFRHDQSLKEFSNIDFQASVDTLHTELVNVDSARFDISLNQDSLFFSSSIANISNEARSEFQVTSTLSDSAMKMKIENFYLGNNQYAWQNELIPTITLERSGNVLFQDFRFQNQNEFIEIRGDITPSRQDSLMFVMRDVNLQRISDLIDGRVGFSGTMNGTLTTRSLMSRPSIQGNMQVGQLKIDDRMVGDARFESQFDPQKNRFNTSIDIVTDSTKYDDYLSQNDGVGQSLHLDGYFVPPNPQAPRDTVFYFDADFKEIDMWIVPHIAPKVFQVVEGVASGNGYITGNMDDYDFNLDFQVQNAFAKPEFLNTNYFLNGHVVFDRQDWLVLDSLNVTDTKGGRGMVHGNVDINDFKPITYTDITLEMDRLHFLNNSYDPDVPFYGSLSGTGALRVTGPNNDMFLRTLSPIEVTQDSRLSIPLLEETELNENVKFIQFVEEFNPKQKGTDASEENDRGGAGQSINQMLENLTFSERFNLDLQFNANNPMTVELIFDQVTKEVLTAQGTGQVRLTMEEENVQMFGRYNIASGRYMFVGGEIFTRPLELEKGGAIIWEGEPDNARLDINAIYNARPSIAPLMGTADNSQGDINGQRVPIDLVVEITGTITSVENNYYFRVPNTFDISSNSTLTAQINELNRDEQQKLIQATSILLTGNFISYQNTNEAYSNIGQSFTRRSTYLNPLLSSQVISPLLSNQINALLNSDVSRFDIDFSLNAYNEIDLGVALRLYNDRLILRREGMITGSENQATLTERIGDLNATYRINRSLSVMAFHRQDQTLGSVTPTPGAGSTVDGIGLEAQVKFNTWKQFFRQIKNTIFGIFGGGDKEDEEKESLADGTATEAIKEE